MLLEYTIRLNISGKSTQDELLERISTNALPSLTFGADFSRLRPAYYTYIFISCDVFSICLQAVGGALASSATAKSAAFNAGGDVMITGLVTQVFTLVVFGILATDYAVAVYRNRNQLNPTTAQFRQSLRFRLFLAALWVAYFCILIRCTYRVAELAGGMWTFHARFSYGVLTC